MKVILNNDSYSSKTINKKFATFYIEDRLFGIDVNEVQEVTKLLAFTQVRTAPSFIKGLVNLRGQISTAICLKELLGDIKSEHRGKMMVVCKVEDILLSFIVDNIGDVLEVEESDFEKVPSTVPNNIRTFMTGVYKTQETILSILSLDEIITQLEIKSAS